MEKLELTAIEILESMNAEELSCIHGGISSSIQKEVDEDSHDHDSNSKDTFHGNENE